MQRSGTGIAVDKMLALTGQTPALQIANIVMPSEEEREALRETDRKLDEITARLAALQSEQSCREEKNNLRAELMSVSVPSVQRAKAKIRDKKLYRPHSTLKEFCRRECGWT